MTGLLVAHVRLRKRNLFFVFFAFQTFLSPIVILNTALFASVTVSVSSNTIKTTANTAIYPSQRIHLVEHKKNSNPEFAYPPNKHLL